MDTWVTLCVLFLLPVLYRIRKHFGRLRVDASDTSRFAGAFKGRRIYTFTGYASDVMKSRTSYVTGQVSSSGGYTTPVSVSGSIQTTVVIDDQFMLTGLNGNVQSFQMRGFNAALGEGHLVSVAWSISGRRKFGYYFLVYDHTTHQRYFSDWAIRKILFPYPKWLQAVLFLLILPIPVLIVIGIIGEIQRVAFERKGAEALIAALSAGVAGVAQRPHEDADGLDRLAQLFREGLMSDDEWTRAKELYLGKPPDARTATVEHLRQLHDLHRAGVLSESEFNSKKWELLAQA